MVRLTGVVSGDHALVALVWTRHRAFRGCGGYLAMRAAAAADSIRPMAEENRDADSAPLRGSRGWALVIRCRPRDGSPLLGLEPAKERRWAPQDIHHENIGDFRQG